MIPGTWDEKNEEGIFSHLVPCRKRGTQKNKTIVLKAVRRHARMFFLLHTDDGPQTAFPLLLYMDGMYNSVIYPYIHGTMYD